MEKYILANEFTESLNTNFSKQSKYFEYQPYLFTELKSPVFEINKCLILGFNRAAITLTNHLLERLLKLALIFNEVGIAPKPIEEWNQSYAKPNKTYNSYQLWESIKDCKKANLITENEETLLKTRVKDIIRNGFAHADPSKILKESEEDTEVFYGDLSNISDLKSINLKHKSIPMMQSINIEEFAKQNAADHFEYIYELIKNIEKRLLAKS